ncbi:hypothetical protein A9Q89_01915 [Gammaproteobacteria bacterium 53_120_T64]|nr:hypothetical protein A9Q89_01915 [Gammaproteobacteria bacterium 53_120_T64]
MPPAANTITAPAASTAIAIIIGETPSYSEHCLRLALQRLYCQVDYLSLAKPIAATPSETLTLHTAEQLKAYQLIIYPYVATRHEYDFSRLSSWLERYQRDWQGRVLVRYHASLGLHHLRAHHGAALHVRQQEQTRQLFSEWVQSNARHFYWSATSPAAAHDLAQWGVIRHPEHMAIAPPYMALHYGAHAERRGEENGNAKRQQPAAKSPRNSSAHQPQVLIVGDFHPGTGHALLLALLADYRQRSAETPCLHFMGGDIAGLGVYREDIKAQVRRLKLEDYVQFTRLNSALTSADYLTHYRNADLLLGVAAAEGYLPGHVQAQAMGLASLVLEPSISPREGADRVQQVLTDKACQRRVVIDGYRHIAQHFSHDGIEQALLSQVLSALCR